MRKALGDTTTENGQPVPMLHAQFDGEVTYSSPSQNSMVVGDERDPSGLIDFTDPAVFWSECARGPVPADGAAFAHAVIADPNFEPLRPSPRASVASRPWRSMLRCPPPAAFARHTARTLNAGSMRSKQGSASACSRRPPGGHLDADPGDHRQVVRGELRGRHRGSRPDHRLDRVPRAATATHERPMDRRQEARGREPW